MTTIAYKSGFMAADDKVTTKHLIEASCYKIYRPNDRLTIGTSGGIDEREIIQKLRGVIDPNQLPPAKWLKNVEGDFEMLLVFHWNYKKPQIFALLAGSEGAGVFEVLDEFYAVGAGAGFALAAMKAGASAERAVKIACELDPRSNGPVEVRKV